MKLREVLYQIGVIAIIHALALYVQFHYLNLFNTTMQTSIVFIPAAVRVISVLVVGYPAALGIVLGVLIHDGLFNLIGFTGFEMAGMAAEQGLVVASSLFVWALVSHKVTGLKSPQIDYSAINAFDVLIICIIQAVINTVCGHLFFAWSPTVQQIFDPYLFAVMLLGDVVGAFFIFILANLLFTLFRRLGLLSRMIALVERR